MQRVTGRRGINSPLAGRTPDQRPDWECTRTARQSTRRGCGGGAIEAEKYHTKAAEDLATFKLIQSFRFSTLLKICMPALWADQHRHTFDISGRTSASNVAMPQRCTTYKRSTTTPQNKQLEDLASERGIKMNCPSAQAFQLEPCGW